MSGNQSESIEFDFYKVESQIRKLEEVISKMQDLKEKNDESFFQIQNSWDSESSRLYIRKMLQQKEKMEATQQKLKSGKEALEASVRVAREIETRAKESVE